MGLATRLREIAAGAEKIVEEMGNAPASEGGRYMAGAVDLEDVERRLTVLDDKVYAAVTGDASEELLVKIRREMDGQLAMYRRKMKAEQIALVERQYLQKRLLEEFGLVRFSLFYFA